MLNYSFLKTAFIGTLALTLFACSDKKEEKKSRTTSC